MRSFALRLHVRDADDFSLFVDKSHRERDQRILHPHAVRFGLWKYEKHALVRTEMLAKHETLRKHLGPNEGMFFVFPQSEPHCMWMKNTLIPLSVAFIDEKGKIVSISDMQPQSETSHCATAPAKFALEMPAGWFAKKGIKSGTTIQGLEKAPAAR